MSLYYKTFYGPAVKGRLHETAKISLIFAVDWFCQAVRLIFVSIRPTDITLHKIGQRDRKIPCSKSVREPGKTRTDSLAKSVRCDKNPKRHYSCKRGFRGCWLLAEITYDVKDSAGHNESNDGEEDEVPDEHVHVDLSPQSHQTFLVRNCKLVASTLGNSWGVSKHLKVYLYAGDNGSNGSHFED